MSEQEIRIGSRGSLLALAQAQLVADAIERGGARTRIVTIDTAGDQRAPDTAWGEGAFVTSIQLALLTGSVDMAVHSAKDVPTDEDPRLRIAGYLARADPRDALVVARDAPQRRLMDLLPGTRVGTDSPRRTGFLLALRPDIVVHPLHGNVDTRIRRLEAGETDALVLACAGLDRIGLGGWIAERLAPEVVPPAPGQGAIAVQVRCDDVRTNALVAALDDPPTRLAVEAEREFLNASGGGCRAPIGALATIAGDELEILGGCTNPDGSGAAFARRRGPVELAGDLARGLAIALHTGARIRMAPRVIVTRAVEQADELVAALRAAGVEPVLVPAIEIEVEGPGGELDAAVQRLRDYAWVVITSANGARAILAATDRVLPSGSAPRWAAIGRPTRNVLRERGVAVAFEPSRANSTTLGAELPIARGDRVLLVRGDLAQAELAIALRARGAAVDDVVGYRTREAPHASRALLRDAIAAGSADAIIFTSGSTVRGLVHLAAEENLDIAAIPSVCIGPETAGAAQEAGFVVIAVSATSDAGALAASTASALAAPAMEIQ